MFFFIFLDVGGLCHLHSMTSNQWQSSLDPSERNCHQERIYFTVNFHRCSIEYFYLSYTTNMIYCPPGQRASAESVIQIGWWSLHERSGLHTAREEWKPLWKERRKVGNKKFSRNLSPLTMYLHSTGMWCVCDDWKISSPCSPMFSIGIRFSLVDECLSFGLRFS